MVIRTGPKVSDGDCGCLSAAVAIWLLEEFQELMVVGQRRLTVAVRGTKTTSSLWCIAIEPPENGGCPAIGLGEVAQRVHIRQTGDLLLGIVLTNHSGDPNLVHGDTTLLGRC